MDCTKLKIPNHVAIIVDGNGRWAKERNLPRLKGHDAGFKNLKKICKHALDKGIKILSVYVFSTENFDRPKEEVEHLMDIFVKMCKLNTEFFMKNNIRVIFSGRDEPLPKKVIEAREELKEKTKNNTGGIFNVCLNYGGRAEIVDAVNKILKEENTKKITIEDFKKYLYQNIPDVDLMIRTSGEQRLSNFLPWQLTYSEFIFTPIKFPDFSTDDFDECILEYTKRDRRFGKISE